MPAVSVPAVVRFMAVTLALTFSGELTLPATLRLPVAFRLAPVMLPNTVMPLAAKVLADRVVNAPEAGVMLPMGMLLIAPEADSCQPWPFHTQVIPPKLYV